MATTAPSLNVGGATYNPAYYNAETIAPTKWDIDDKQTVAGQIKGILASNSPLLQQAETAAKQAANARGLANSSMAVTAGQSALYNAALPIAQADAQTHASNAQYNADAANTATKYNADATNTANQYNANATNQMVIQQMQETNKLQLADIEASYKTVMQLNASAGELYQQSVKNITDIIGNKDLDSDAKDAAINQQLNYLKQGMNMFGSINNINISSMLNF
ncbi:MAG: hypothetical protein LBT97_12985 [Planctomycetota bacterium]|jgi:hypothetical protein|nr:hypothetical protein [Planctomycetota bacterium]